MNSETMKISELSKPLNPEAEEWRPTAQRSPPLKLHCYFYHLSHNVCTHRAQPACTICFPATHYWHKAADVGTPIFEEEEKKVISSRNNKCPKSPCHKVPWMNLPPRLRRKKKKPKNEAQLPKQEWRLKNTSSLSNLKVSGDGSATVVKARMHPPHASRTTVMIKNIPNQIGRDFMLKFLDGYCRTYSLEYDFFYLPMDFRKLGNLGYAFVNFTTVAAAMKLKKNLQNYKWGALSTDDGETILSRKVCEITWARIQGKEALARRFENSSFNCNDMDFLPVLLDPPRNGLDPNPPPPVNLGRLGCSSLSGGA